MFVFFKNISLVFCTFGCQYTSAVDCLERRLRSYLLCVRSGAWDVNLATSPLTGFCHALLCIERTMPSCGVCPSVFPSRSCIVLKQVNINYPQTFSPSGRPTILDFPHQSLWQYSNGAPQWERRKQVVSKIAILDQYIAYLGNDTRQGHSYYGTPVGTRIAISIESSSVVISSDIE